METAITPTDNSSHDDRALTVARRGATAVVTIDRGRAGNAIDAAMGQTLRDALGKLGRDPGIYAVVLRSAVDGVFSCGTDMVEIAGLADAGNTAAVRAALIAEMELCWLIECLSKPMAALIDGAVSSSAVGLLVHGTHRVAGPRATFAFPDVALGRVPSWGTTHRLARMPDGIGRYLASTGRAFGPADALALGLVTHTIDATHFAEIETRLADADPIDPILDGLHRDPGPSELMADRARIARFFVGGGIAEIVARLEAARGDDGTWAETVLADIGRAAPKALLATDLALDRARHLDIRATLLQDFRIGLRLATTGDFATGARLAATSSDSAGGAATQSQAATSRARSGWSPAALGDVPAEEVARLLADLGHDEPSLKTRTEMQAARF